MNNARREIVQSGGQSVVEEELDILRGCVASSDSQQHEALPNCSLEGELKLNSVKLRGYTVGELMKIAERARLAPNWREGERPSTSELQRQMLEWAQIGITATADCRRRRIKFFDVAALWSVKQRLTEVLVWPSKFPDLYASCGVKVGRNVILHGPSGCGKTMLLHAVAGETEMHTTFIKGPELLSKYIGESEENVRRVFQRARDSPSATLLIFDEFDALVPARGHDSTGVTDRVVNQFLTELDGIGDGQTKAVGKADVYVIAATNRLHAIDKALLRAGRFDHKILITHPANTDERSEILRLRSNGVCMCSHVDWTEIAEATEGWTGAQLEALIINANFLAARETEATAGEHSTPVIESRHLLEIVRREKEASRPKSHVTAPQATLA